MSRRCGSSKPTRALLNGEASKPTRSAKKKGKERRPIRKGQDKRQRKPPAHHLKGGAGRECVDGEAENRMSSPTLENVSCATMERPDYPGRPRHADGGCHQDIIRRNIPNPDPKTQKSKEKRKENPDLKTQKERKTIERSGDEKISYPRLLLDIHLR